MEDCKRCPFCHKLPLLVPDLNLQWRGGCASGETELCASLKDVVHQQTQLFAVNQWNYVVTPIIEMLALRQTKAA